MSKLTHFTFSGQALPVEYVETQQVKEGVECDVYKFKADNTKDLAIVRVKKGCTTPIQLIMKGNKTTEGFSGGRGVLEVKTKSGEVTKYPFPETEQKEVELGIGDTMQWEAKEDLMFYEICDPPYEDGRFKDLT
jgi:hypothetical protein